MDLHNLLMSTFMSGVPVLSFCVSHAETEELVFGPGMILSLVHIGQLELRTPYLAK